MELKKLCKKLKINWKELASLLAVTTFYLRLVRAGKYELSPRLQRRIEILMKIQQEMGAAGIEAELQKAKKAGEEKGE